MALKGKGNIWIIATMASLLVLVIGFIGVQLSHHQVPHVINGPSESISKVKTSFNDFKKSYGEVKKITQQASNKNTEGGKKHTSKIENELKKTVQAIDQFKKILSIAPQRSSNIYENINFHITDIEGNFAQLQGMSANTEDIPPENISGFDAQFKKIDDSLKQLESLVESLPFEERIEKLTAQVNEILAWAWQRTSNMLAVVILLQMVLNIFIIVFARKNIKQLSQIQKSIQESSHSASGDSIVKQNIIEEKSKYYHSKIQSLEKLITRLTSELSEHRKRTEKVESEIIGLNNKQDDRTIQPTQESPPPEPDIPIVPPIPSPEYISLTTLRQLYNNHQRENIRKYLVNQVSETPQSIETRRADNTQLIKLEAQSPGSYWILKQDQSAYWLIPDPDFCVSEGSYPTLSALFKCGDDNYSNQLILQTPAEVSLNNQELWELKKKGEIKFG